MRDPEKVHAYRAWKKSHMLKLKHPIALASGGEMIRCYTDSGTITYNAMEDCSIIGLFDGNLLVNKPVLTFNPSYPKMFWHDSISLSSLRHKSDFLEKVLTELV